MNRKLTAAVFAAIFALGLAARPAYADCAADIKKLEDRLQAMDSRDQQTARIRGFIEKAKELNAKGKKKGCAKQAKLADQKLAEKGL